MSSVRVAQRGRGRTPQNALNDPVRGNEPAQRASQFFALLSPWCGPGAHGGSKLMSPELSTSWLHALSVPTTRGVQFAQRVGTGYPQGNSNPR